MSNQKLNRQTLIKELALAAMFLSLVIIFLLLTYVIPFSFLLMIVFVPFLAAILALKTHLRIQVLFFLAATVASLIDIQEGFFYLLPNILIGLFFGGLSRKKIPAIGLMFATAFVSCLLNAMMHFPILFLFKIDIIEVFATLFHLKREVFLFIYPSFCLLLAIFEVFILLVICMDEFKKFGIKILESIEDKSIGFFSLILLVVSFVLNRYYKNMFVITLIPCTFLPLAYTIISSCEFKGNKRKIFLLLPIIAIALFFTPYAFDSTKIYLGFLPALTPFPLMLIIFKKCDQDANPSSLVTSNKKADWEDYDLFDIYA